MLHGRELSFALPAYDTRHPLIIDPVFKLLYSTYLGGVHDDQVGGMVLDANNNAYVIGNSGSEDWPVSGNAYQSKRKAIGSYVRNVVVTKFDASGAVVYSTFIGGSTNDYGTSIAIDGAGNAYLTGYTTSSDFPVTTNAFAEHAAGQPERLPRGALIRRLGAQLLDPLRQQLVGPVGRVRCQRRTVARRQRRPRPHDHHRRLQADAGDRQRRLRRQVQPAERGACAAARIDVLRRRQPAGQQPRHRFRHAGDDTGGRRFALVSPARPTPPTCRRPRAR